MILQQFLPFALVFYRQALLALAQEVFQAEALSHASNHLLVRLDELLDFTPLEKACASYRHTHGAGCPATYSIALLVRAILVGWLYGLSLRQLEAHLHYDFIKRYFVGCQPGEPVPDHTTLERFELWLFQTQSDLYFSQLLSQIDQHFPHERQLIQIGDTYAMHANAADEGLVQRLRHLCLRLTVELQDRRPGKFELNFQGFDWAALFGPKPETMVVRTGKVGREQRLERTVLAVLDFRQRVEQILATCPVEAVQRIRSWCTYLDKVLEDEVKVERDAHNQPVKVTELSVKDKGDFRMISATDPEASLRFHKDDLALGYNVQIAVTGSGFIRETQANTGAMPDQSGVAALIGVQKQRQEQAGEALQLPPKLIYDQAAGTGKTRAEVEAISDGQTQLVAKIKEPAVSADRLSPYDYQLSPDRQTLTCPGGKASSTTKPFLDSYGRNFVFAASHCWQGEPPRRMKSADLSQRCPLWERCRGLRSGPRQTHTVFISDYRDQTLAAQAYNQTESFQKEMRQRPLVERVIFELTHYHGARRCRRRGRLAADYQAKMCATAYNLKLLVLKLGRKEPRHRLAPLAG